jgi:hypothetical protein
MNERLIRGKISLEASAKIRISLFFAELLPQPLGGAHDRPGTTPTEVPPLTHELPLPILFDRQGSMRECDAAPLNESYIATAEVLTGPTSSNWSIPNQSSPMFTLGNPLEAPPAPSPREEPAFEERSDKPYELDDTSIKSP